MKKVARLKNKPSACHPDSREYARGRCLRCYRQELWANRHKPKRPKGKTECHPERKHFARNLCTKCYHIKHRIHGARKRRYGITVEFFESLWARQLGLCPIGLHGMLLTGHSPDSVVVDHDHGDGRVRGLLCRRHNSALGFFHDSAVELYRALEYLAQPTAEAQP